MKNNMLKATNKPDINQSENFKPSAVISCLIRRYEPRQSPWYPIKSCGF